MKICTSCGISIEPKEEHVAANVWLDARLPIGNEPAHPRRRVRVILCAACVPMQMFDVAHNVPVLSLNSTAI